MSECLVLVSLQKHNEARLWSMDVFVFPINYKETLLSVIKSLLDDFTCLEMLTGPHLTSPKSNSRCEMKLLDVVKL